MRNLRLFLSKIYFIICSFCLVQILLYAFTSEFHGEGCAMGDKTFFRGFPWLRHYALCILEERPTNHVSFHSASFLNCQCGISSPYLKCGRKYCRNRETMSKSHLTDIQGLKLLNYWLRRSQYLESYGTLLGLLPEKFCTTKTKKV